MTPERMEAESYFNDTTALSLVLTAGISRVTSNSLCGRGDDVLVPTMRVLFNFQELMEI